MSDKKRPDCPGRYCRYPSDFQRNYNESFLEIVHSGDFQSSTIVEDLAPAGAEMSPLTLPRKKM